MRSRFELWLNRLARPELALAGYTVSSFQVCGVTGFSLALVTALLLDFRLGLSSGVTLAIGAAGAGTFFALAMAFKIVTGREELIYYHHEIAVVSVAALLLHFLHVPPGSYLDQTVLGVGIMLMCGRIGCLMVGCCHGHPASWGIRYRKEHAKAGFPDWLVGVPLFPVQLAEALSLLGILATTYWLVLTQPPGTGLAWYVGAYAMLRFGMEFLRGDVGRPSLAGFSEAQWTSLVLCVAAGSVFVGCRWVAAFLALSIIVIAVMRKRQQDSPHHLLDPRHVREVAEALSRATHAPAREPRVESTSLGIRLSCGEVPLAGNRVQHYSLSATDAPLSQRAARVLASLVLHLRHPTPDMTKLIAGGSGVFHLLVPVKREGA